MASEQILQYINEHTAAGTCLYDHYNGSHDNSRCTLPAGYCSVIAYAAALIRQAETQAQQTQWAQAQWAQYHPAPVPFVPPEPIPPVTSDGELPVEQQTSSYLAGGGGGAVYPVNGGNGSNGGGGQGGGGHPGELADWGNGSNGGGGGYPA